MQKFEIEIEMLRMHSNQSTSEKLRIDMLCILRIFINIVEIKFFL